VDIVTFDLSNRLPFRFKPGPLQAALKRGVHFEVWHLPCSAMVLFGREHHSTEHLPT